MKKTAAIITALALLLCGCGTAQTDADISTTASAGITETTPTSTTETAPTSTTETALTTTSASTSEATSASVSKTDTQAITSETSAPSAADENTVQQAELPSMDGSTSAIPLEAGLKAKLLGISYTEASELVSHNKTHISFQNLLDGTVDLIFTVPISDEQQKKADDAGVELVSTPVAKEGFVFVVNVNNPVESLTQQQIKDIYSGKITNWKEVGGNDAEIIPYQRNSDSGSQNYMAEFMGETPLVKAKTELYVAGMGGLLDRIALYDNSVNSIGYSVYSYAAQMYANDNKVKFIAVDGIAPTKETMANGSYPLCSCTYIMHTDKADEKTREFTEWAASDEGQLCVLQSGYLPVNGMEIPDEYMPYSAVGTGKAKPADYTPSKEYALFHASDGYGIDRVEGKYTISFLADKEFQKQINADMAEVQEYLEPFKPDWTDYGGNDYYYYPKDLMVDVRIINGYMSVFFCYATPGAEYDQLASYSYGCYDKAACLVYDLIEQKRITEFSDLFYEGENFVPMINNALNEHAAMYALESNIGKKGDFTGLLGEVEVFTLTGVCLNENNTYFNGTPYLSFEENDPIKDSMIIWEYRNCDGIFTYESYVFTVSEFIYGRYDTDEGIFMYIESSRFHSDEEIAELNEKYEKIQKNAYAYAETIGLGIYSPYVSFDERMGVFAVGFEVGEVFFDPETCERIPVDVLLCENWRDYFSVKEKETLIEIVSVGYYGDDGNAYVGAPYKEDGVTITGAYTYIPIEKLNPKYFSYLTAE